MNLSEHIHDFQRRYQGTVVMLKMPPKEEHVAMHISAIEYDGDCGASISMSNHRLGKLIINLMSEYEMKFEFPKCGVFQLNTDAIIFRRQPKRQWRKGICADNSIVTPVYASVIAAKGPAIGTETVEAAFAGKTYSVKEALNGLESGFRSVALEKNFALCRSFVSGSGHVLFHWGRVIGNLSVDKNTLFLSEKILLPEVRVLFSEMEIRCV